MSHRAGVVCDFREEQWVSMDLVADQLLAHGAAAETDFVLERILPDFRRRFSGAGAGPDATGWNRRRFTADRVLNRFVDYPRHLSRMWDDYDVFHVVDHAYAQLVHALPSDRTVVTCHDLHSFGALLADGPAKRSWFFRQTAERVLSGLQKAALIVTDTGAVRDELVERGLVPPDRLRVVGLGVDPAFSHLPDEEAENGIDRIVGEQCTDYLLHVGGTFARKRIDLLLRIFAAVREKAEIELVRVGGPLTAPQQELARDLGVEDSIRTLPFLDVRALAGVYRRAALTVLPSGEEGFGLPVVESMRCGTPVVASDLNVLREVGGEAAEYRAVGDVEGWSATILELLTEREEEPDRWSARTQAALMQAEKYSWTRYTEQMIEVYRELIG